MSARKCLEEIFGDSSVKSKKYQEYILIIQQVEKLITELSGSLATGAKTVEGVIEQLLSCTFDDIQITQFTGLCLEVNGVRFLNQLLARLQPAPPMGIDLLTEAVCYDIFSFNDQVPMSNIYILFSKFNAVKLKHFEISGLSSRVDSEKKYRFHFLQEVSSLLEKILAKKEILYSEKLPAVLYGGLSPFAGAFNFYDLCSNSPGILILRTILLAPGIQKMYAEQLPSVLFDQSKGKGSTNFRLLVDSPSGLSLIDDLLKSYPVLIRSFKNEYFEEINGESVFPSFMKLLTHPIGRNIFLQLYQGNQKLRVSMAHDLLSFNGVNPDHVKYTVLLSRLSFMSIENAPILLMILMSQPELVTLDFISDLFELSRYINPEGVALMRVSAFSNLCKPTICYDEVSGDSFDAGARVLSLVLEIARKRGLEGEFWKKMTGIVLARVNGEENTGISLLSMMSDRYILLKGILDRNPDFCFDLLPEHLLSAVDCHFFTDSPQLKCDPSVTDPFTLTRFGVYPSGLEFLANIFNKNERLFQSKEIQVALLQLISCPDFFIKMTRKQVTLLLLNSILRQNQAQIPWLEILPSLMRPDQESQDVSMPPFPLLRILLHRADFLPLLGLSELASFEISEGIELIRALIDYYTLQPISGPIFKELLQQGVMETNGALSLHFNLKESKREDFYIIKDQGPVFLPELLSVFMLLECLMGNACKKVKELEIERQKFEEAALALERERLAVIAENQKQLRNEQERQKQILRETLSRCRALTSTLDREMSLRGQNGFWKEELKKALNLVDLINTQLASIAARPSVNKEQLEQIQAKKRLYLGLCNAQMGAAQHAIQSIQEMRDRQSVLESIFDQCSEESPGSIAEKIERARALETQGSSLMAKIKELERKPHSKLEEVSVWLESIMKEGSEQSSEKCSEELPCSLQVYSFRAALKRLQQEEEAKAAKVALKERAMQEQPKKPLVQTKAVSRGAAPHDSAPPAKVITSQRTLGEEQAIRSFERACLMHMFELCEAAVRNKGYQNYKPAILTSITDFIRFAQQQPSLRACYERLKDLENILVHAVFLTHYQYQAIEFEEVFYRDVIQAVLSFNLRVTRMTDFHLDGFVEVFNRLWGQHKLPSIDKTFFSEFMERKSRELVLLNAQIIEKGLSDYHYEALYAHLREINEIYCLALRQEGRINPECRGQAFGLALKADSIVARTSKKLGLSSAQVALLDEIRLERNLQRHEGYQSVVAETKGVVTRYIDQIAGSFASTRAAELVSSTHGVKERRHKGRKSLSVSAASCAATESAHVMKTHHDGRHASVKGAEAKVATEDFNTVDS